MSRCLSPRRRGGGVVVLALALAVAGFGADREPPAAPMTPPAGEGTPLGYGTAATLGVVEGLTEYLPVSSTGHLLLANHYFHLDREAPARDRAGVALTKKGQPFTVNNAADTFVIVIQFGAILAVALIYWRQLAAIVAGMLGRDPAGLRLLRNLVIGFIPAGVVGLTLHNWVERNLFSNSTIVAALVVGAVVMLIVSRWQRARAANAAIATPDPLPSDLTPRQALIVGLLQCFALWPGMSRSMLTLVGGYLVGLRPPRAAEFSFLLGLVTLTAATVYKSVSSGALMLKAFGTAPILVGCLVATIAAAIAVRWMIGYLNRHGLALFAWYRIALAVAVLAFWP